MHRYGGKQRRVTRLNMMGGSLGPFLEKISLGPFLKKIGDKEGGEGEGGEGGRTRGGGRGGGGVCIGMEESKEE